MATVQCSKWWATGVGLEQWTLLLRATASRHANCHDRQHSLVQMEAWEAPGTNIHNNVLGVCRTQHSLRASHILYHRRVNGILHV